ncbi:autotransporter domain-containing protein [Bradyrhizobium japonicum]|uniref:autotransporter domain-containing protein n=1 Tax=Bradyrhizobium japonicum TaxID=375 RepID=UPI001BA92486|nr:autotransporter domain-containing protein [Bradyrhizobium japonicum]MBR0991628.1 autotransporter domain-containing protein [Bradyrhizobium japonicum]
MAIDVANQADWNTAVAAVAAAGANSTVSINITSGFTLSSSLAQLQASNANVVINITGNNQVINGASAFQGIQVNGTNAPTVNISSLSITNTAALGGNGQNGQDGYFSGGLSYGSGGGGGGGLGAGGGLFVGSGANVTLAAVTFTGNTATGGTGGNGGSAQNAAPDPVNGGNGGNGGAANNGGAGGGGGAGGTGGHAGNQGTAGTAGGTLGAGGGGGGGSGTTNSTTYTSNNSGGSGNANGGNGGSGGDGATNASGSGGPGPGADGGAGGNGGAANGGAIYVATGGTLTILNSPISGAAVTGGAAGTPGIGIGPSAINGFSAAAGAAQGAGIFLSGVTANIGVSGGTVTYANTIGGSGLTTGGVNTALIKTGVGTLVLSAANTYSGNTVVNAGTLEVNGTAANSALTTVNSGGQLAGVGTVKGTQINAGGTFAPGNGTPASTMSVNGNLAFQSGAIYLIQVDPTTASRANVSGTATLNGTVNATFASGTYVAKQYTILNATGGVSGTFAGVVNIGNPANLRSSLSYDANNAYLNVTLGFNGFTTNQQNVGNALINFFNANGGIPAVYANLSPAELTQASGEAATGSQQTTFNAMTMFMGIMTDPFIAGRGEGGSAGGGATGYADEELAYAASRKPADAMAAIYAKAPRPAPFAQRWSVWAAGYGGSQTTDGNAVVGSNTATSSIYGTAVGADYRISPYTIAGFALAGGGTNFNVVNSGYGQSYLFQAGAFVRHTIGAAYLSGALAYGAQDITTNRIVTIAGTDRLQARFNANAYSGRVEGGYRFVTPWMNGVGITPYAAGQFTTFDLPAYTESAISGGGAFALAYGAKSVTDTRSELGVRTDKSFAMDGALLTLRGRAAWSHDYNPDRTIGATFTALPGASFVVNGAAQASDSALVTAAAEMKWMNGWSAVGTFEGEFSNVTRSYAGKGVVRYNW